MQSMVLDTKEDSDKSTLGLEEYHFHHPKTPKYHSSVSCPIPWHQLSCVTDPQGCNTFVTSCHDDLTTFCCRLKRAFQCFPISIFLVPNII
ncbi:hypothetical protein QQP08_004327 [Theobroma cacao]|nr:hypothetical protein QQP08_004327 [Theobroma cacao]